MDRRVQQLCLWSGPVFLLLFLTGFWFVGGLVPPPSATDGAAKIAAFYHDNASALRAGMLITLISVPFYVPFAALITLQLKQSDRRLEPLAWVQFGLGIITILELLLPVVLIAAAAFRPDRAPQSTLLLNDTAFTIFLWAFSAPTVEFAVIAIAILMDRSEKPLFPRWTAYLDLAVAVIFVAGAPTIFVKRGAFGWDGAIAFWAVVASFGVWVAVTFVTMYRAINRTAVEQLSA